MRTCVPPLGNGRARQTMQARLYCPRGRPAVGCQASPGYLPSRRTGCSPFHDRRLGSSAADIWKRDRLQVTREPLPEGRDPGVETTPAVAVSCPLPADGLIPRVRRVPHSGHQHGPGKRFRGTSSDTAASIPRRQADPAPGFA